MISRASGNAKGLLKPIFLPLEPPKLLKLNQGNTTSFFGHDIQGKIRTLQIGQFEKEACRKTLQDAWLTLENPEYVIKLAIKNVKRKLDTFQLSDRDP